MERRKNDARRSTRLALQVPVVVTGLDPACDFHKECKTVFVNAHGCGFIARERLKDGNGSEDHRRGVCVYIKEDTIAQAARRSYRW